MANEVNSSPSLSFPGSSDTEVLNAWASAIGSELGEIFAEYGVRVNLSLPKDGSEPMTGPLTLAQYTVATRPAAASVPWAIIAVTDGGAGAECQMSNGTAWINLG